jgi:hypothetical protein
MAVIDHGLRWHDSLPIARGAGAVRVKVDRHLSDHAWPDVFDERVFEVVFNLRKETGFAASRTVEHGRFSKRQDCLGAIETTFPLVGFSLGRNSFRPDFVRRARRAS